MPVQYAVLMRRLFLTRDLPSFVNRGQLVVPAVLRAAPVTLALTAGAAVLWLAAGLGIGLLAAAWRGTAVDRLVVAAGLLGVSIPAFWLGEVVVLVSQGGWGRGRSRPGCSPGCRRSVCRRGMQAPGCGRWRCRG